MKFAFFFSVSKSIASVQVPTKRAPREMTSWGPPPQKGNPKAGVLVGAKPEELEDHYSTKAKEACPSLSSERGKDTE